MWPCLGRLSIRNGVLLILEKPKPQEPHRRSLDKNLRNGSIVLSERNFLMNKTQLKSILFTFVLLAAIVVVELFKKGVEVFIDWLKQEYATA